MKKLISIILAISEMFTASCAAARQVPSPSEWAKEYVNEADRAGITADTKVVWTENITRHEFCKLAYNMLSKVTDMQVGELPSPFSDVADEAVTSLYVSGIIYGKSETVFAPNDTLTREEAAAILDRISVKLELIHHELYYMFDDEAEISDWARNSVQVACNLGVMEGVGDNKFAPKGGYTAEQAAATLMRIYRIVQPETAFADKLNAQMPEDKNYMFSPLSIKMALMMAANGADGDTQREILNAVGVTDLDAYNSEVKASLARYSQSELLKLNIANSIWINSDKTPQRYSDEYTNTLADIYNAQSGTVTNKTAVKEINGWVNDKTEGKIPSIISEQNTDFWAMLVNAVYFKGRWQDTFNKAATQPDTFTQRGGTETTVDFMNKTAWLNYAVNNDVQIIELPYLAREPLMGGNGDVIDVKKLEDIDISMYLMMSDHDFNPEAVLAGTELKRTYTALSVPKFNIEYSAGLNDMLKKTGINKAFTEQAEFNKMFTDGNMWITDTIHKTFIKVDEEGTEAAAVTGIGMAGSALPPEPVTVKYNKPFTFVIRDDFNGELLFVGEYAYGE